MGPCKRRVTWEGQLSDADGQTFLSHAPAVCIGHKAARGGCSTSCPDKSCMVYTAAGWEGGGAVASVPDGSAGGLLANASKPASRMRQAESELEAPACGITESHAGQVLAAQPYHHPSSTSPFPA